MTATCQGGGSILHPDLIQLPLISAPLHLLPVSVGVLAVLSCAVSSACANTAGAAAREDAARTDPYALAPAAPSRWAFSGEAGAGFGWKDNVLLSVAHPIARSFALTRLEGLAWRRPTGPWEIIMFGEAQHIRFLPSTSESDGETEAFLHAETRFAPEPTWRLMASLQGYHQDQVFDLSTDTATPVVMPLRVSGGLASLGWRTTLAKTWWAEVRTQAHRSDVNELALDYNELRGLASAGWRRANWSASATLSQRWRDYDDRHQYTLGGRELPGSQLEFRQQEASLTAAWKERSDRGAHGVEISAGHVASRDNGSGYFDYDQPYVRLTLSWESLRWQVDLSGRWGGYRYLNQTVGIGFDPPSRQRDEWESSLEVSRSFGNRWKGVFAASTEHSLSNQEATTYRANSAHLGAHFLF